MIPHYGAWSWRFASSSGEIYHGNGVWIADRCTIAIYIHRTYHLHTYLASCPLHVLVVIDVCRDCRVSAEQAEHGRLGVPPSPPAQLHNSITSLVASVSPTFIDALRGSSDSYHDRGFQPNDHSWRRDGLRASHLWSSRHPDASDASPVAVWTRSGDGVVG